MGRRRRTRNASRFGICCGGAYVSESSRLANFFSDFNSITIFFSPNQSKQHLSNSPPRCPPVVYRTGRRPVSCKNLSTSFNTVVKHNNNHGRRPYATRRLRCLDLSWAPTVGCPSWFHATTTTWGKQCKGMGRVSHGHPITSRCRSYNLLVAFSVFTTRMSSSL
jgi:hypothetical protein